MYTRLVIGKDKIAYCDENLCVILFSEENIWKLCESWKKNDPNHLKNIYAVFISNERREIPMWEQRSATNNEHLAIWVCDHHQMTQISKLIFNIFFSRIIMLS